MTQKVQQAASRVGRAEKFLNRGCADSSDKFDTEEFVTFTVDGFPDSGYKRTFDVNIERAPTDRDITLFRVEIEWFGVNTEDIKEMERRGTEILKTLHNALESNFDVESPQGEVVVPSDQGL